MFDGTMNIKWMILLEACGAVGEKFTFLFYYVLYIYIYIYMCVCDFF